jgi:hypothetical protein
MSIDGRIAGHLFVDAPDGGRVCSCGKTWENMVENRGRWTANAHGVAHNGVLVDREVQELLEEEARLLRNRMAACLRY